MPEADDRALAEDVSCPVEVQPGADYANPTDWSWRRIGASQPTKANFHLSHTDVTRVMVDVLRPSDASADAPFVLRREIPILIIDSLDKYWAGESRSRLPLQGLRVPVEGDTVADAKRALAADLGAQLRLLLLLSNSYGRKLSPQLESNLECLRSFLAPQADLKKPEG